MRAKMPAENPDHQAIEGNGCDTRPIAAPAKQRRSRTGGTRRINEWGYNLPIMASIEVTDGITIDESELQFEFVRATGPGGQNVNKVSSAVQLRFDLASSPSLSEAVRARLRRIAGKRVSEDGVLVIHARRFRTQEQNRQDAVQRLVALVQQASKERRLRVKTTPTAASRQRRLEAKRLRSQTKRQRQKVGWED